MLRPVLVACTAAAMLSAVLTGAQAQSHQPRFALVIGNSSYQAVGVLPNPVRDAEAVRRLLDAAGFEVTTALDLDRDAMREAVRSFADRLAGQGADSVALIYFAGHGVQVDGENYLLPVDADIGREADIPLAGVRLADVMATLDTVPSRTRIVILDACRNNPFDQAGTDIGRGLAVVHAPAGSVVAYSTSPGATAEDGTGANSPFTAALVAAARRPGARIETILQDVRVAVHQATRGRQTPWEITALTEPFTFFPGSAEAAEPPAFATSEADWRRMLKGRTADEAYEIALREDKVVVYRIFIELHPRARFGGRVRALLERRLEMLAWFEAVTRGTPEAFEAFLARYPGSDLAATARRLEERSRSRAALLDALPEPLLPDAPATPLVRTVIKEVPVIREVRVPSPPEIRTVTKEVIKEVKVPVIREVVREVKVPVVKEVVRIKEVKVPVIKEVVREVKVPVPVPCRCNGQQGPRQTGPIQTIDPKRIPRRFLR